MRIALVTLILILTQARYTESVHGVYYPNANEVDCFTDDCLEAGVLPLNVEVLP